MMKKILSFTLKSPKKPETCEPNRTLNDIMVTENEKRKKQSFRGKTNILHRILRMELMRGIKIIDYIMNFILSVERKIDF